MTPALTGPRWWRLFINMQWMLNNVSGWWRLMQNWFVYDLNDFTPMQAIFFKLLCQILVTLSNQWNQCFFAIFCLWWHIKCFFSVIYYSSKLYFCASQMWGAGSCRLMFRVFGACCERARSCPTNNVTICRISVVLPCLWSVTLLPYMWISPCELK